MTLIEIALAVAALYCGGMWLFQAFVFYRSRKAFALDPNASARMENHTFHLGLCFILALGFLGLVQ